MVALATETFTTPGTSTRVAATDGTAVIECWGAGGGGGQGGGESYGGGGGAYSKKTYSVTALQSFDIIVPSGGIDGAANSGPGGLGGDATFKITGSTELCKAKGGGGGYSGTGGGIGGAASSGIGDTKYSGGTAYAEGGASSAGTAANGNDSSSSTGASAPTGGGAGGDGDSEGSADGISGTQPGGGGGASYNLTPGTGGAGKVIITCLKLIG